MILPIALATGFLAMSVAAEANATERSRGVVVEPIATLEGNLWEEGGWDPPFVAGDELQVVGVVGEIESHMELPWEWESYSYTFWAHSMIAVSEFVQGNTRSVTYAGGEFAIYREPLPSNHDYGVNPPNETSPSTFSDGELFLGGDIGGSEIEFNATSLPKHLGLNGLSYTSGTVLDIVHSQCGDCLGQGLLFIHQNGAPQIGEVPDGYDFGFTGTLDNYFAISVEEQSWGRLKALYR